MSSSYRSASRRWFIASMMASVRAMTASTASSTVVMASLLRKGRDGTCQGIDIVSVEARYARSSGSDWRDLRG